MLTLLIAQQSVLTKNVRNWGITELQGFPSGSEAIRNVLIAACCGFLLSNYVDLNSTSSRTQMVETSVGVACILKWFQLRVHFFALGLVYRRRSETEHGGHGPFAF